MGVSNRTPCAHAQSHGLQGWRSATARSGSGSDEGAHWAGEGTNLKAERACDSVAGLFQSFPSNAFNTQAAESAEKARPTLCVLCGKMHWHPARGSARERREEHLPARRGRRGSTRPPDSQPPALNFKPGPDRKLKFQVSAFRLHFLSLRALRGLCVSILKSMRIGLISGSEESPSSHPPCAHAQSHGLKR